MRASTGILNSSAHRCVIFDFDGTVADTKPTIVRTAAGVLEEWGIPADVVAAKVDQLIGPPFPEAFSWVCGVSEDDAREITRRYRERYLTSGPEAWPFFAGMHELLKELRSSGRLVAIASSKLQSAVDKAVADNRAEGLFDVVVGKCPGVDTKDDAIREAIARLGCTAENAVMVGDRHHDVEGAHVCGIPCIGVLFGNTASREELEEAGAVAVVDTVAELREVLLGTDVRAE